MNSGNKDEARKAIHKAVHKEKSLVLPKEIKSTKAEHLDPLIDAFQRKHQPISHYFCTGVGIDLQYLDSQIAERVLLHFSKMGYAQQRSSSTCNRLINIGSSQLKSEKTYSMQS